MAKLSILQGATSQSVNVFVRDSSSTTGGGLAAVAPAGGSLLTGTKLYYSFTGANASAGVAVSLSVLAAVNSAWSSAGIVTLDGTNMVGWVRIDIPNAALVGSKGRVVSFLLFGGTNMAPTPFEIELTGFDNQSVTDGGLSKLTSLTFTGANKVDASVRDWVGDTIPARNVTGVPIVDAKYLLGTVFATPATAGIMDVNAKNINNVATTSVTTISANVGTTQPVNFSGTGATAYVKSDAEQWLGGTIPAVNVTGVPLVDAKYLLGTVFSTPTVAGIPNVNAKTWNDLATVALPLVPTVAGRTLDVSAGGEAGLDWANIGSPTTVVGLTNTTVGIVSAYTGNTPQTGDVYAALTGVNTELSSPPAITASILSMVKWLFTLAKNKRTQTSTTELVRNDADAATIGTSAKSDDGTTFIRGKYS